MFTTTRNAQTSSHTPLWTLITNTHGQSLDPLVCAENTSQAPHSFDSECNERIYPSETNKCSSTQANTRQPQATRLFRHSQRHRASYDRNTPAEKHITGTSCGCNRTFLVTTRECSSTQVNTPTSSHAPLWTVTHKTHRADTDPNTTRSTFTIQTRVVWRQTQSCNQPNQSNLTLERERERESQDDDLL